MTADRRYLPIAEHGVIGDLHTVALVGTDGTIDWYCPERFDAPSVFAAILDAEKGGYFRIAPAHSDYATKQLYFPDTNVLITRFLTPHGVGEVQDFMPIHRDPEHRRQLLRRVLGVRGEMKFMLVCRPRFDYGRATHTTLIGEHGATFSSDDLRLALVTATDLEPLDDGVAAEFRLTAGESAIFSLEQAGEGPLPPLLTDEEAAEAFEDTVRYWRGWLHHSVYRGRWREMVNRSALTLKLLTYRPTGAIVAAATTSLPEQLGGERNWDYRYTWIRDAAFSLYALLRLGFTEEAEAFMRWLTDRFRESAGRGDGPLQIMYGVDGRADLEEEVLDHFEGYARIGSGADRKRRRRPAPARHLRRADRLGVPLQQVRRADLLRRLDGPREGARVAVRELGPARRGHLGDAWRAPAVHLLAAHVVGGDRARDPHGAPARPPGRPRRLALARDEVTEQIMTRGWSEKRGAFVQHYESDVLDASLLLMPLTRFIAPKDPRWLSTLDAIGTSSSPTASSTATTPPPRRTGSQGDEGTFSICSFWYVEAMARAGRLDEARLAFEKMLTYANHLGLYSEEIGPSGELLGNFPQAFTHLALISAAVNLDQRLG